MTLAPDDDLNGTARQRARDQIGLLRQAFGTTILVDSDDDADFGFACSSEHVLVNSGDVRRVRNYFNRRANDPADDVFSGGDHGPSNQPRGRPFRRYVLPKRSGAVPGDKGLLLSMDEIDRDLGPGVVVPDHIVHICMPVGSHCPATEPTESGLAEPWPPKVTGSAGKGVRVVVIDTGWYAPQPLPWEHLSGVQGQPEPGGVFDAQNRIRPYAGHGTFVAGVIRSMAPECTIYVVTLPMSKQLSGGGVFESDMVTTLEAALTHRPHLINFSAGCPTRHQRPARAFEHWWDTVVARRIRPKPLLVAAAGNNSRPWGFWPASSDWAVGVGSLDHDGSVSDFSNFGNSVDVYALGRNLVNAFPKGEYTCNEAPNRGDVRIFDNNYARWSGTSFSTPLVTGVIAAAMSPDGAGAPTMTALQAKDTVLALGDPPLMRRAVRSQRVPVVGDDFLTPQP
jgi:hypothetical protein